MECPVVVRQGVSRSNLDSLNRGNGHTERCRSLASLSRSEQFEQPLIPRIFAALAWLAAQTVVGPDLRFLMRLGKSMAGPKVPEPSSPSLQGVVCWPVRIRVLATVAKTKARYSQALVTRQPSRQATCAMAARDKLDFQSDSQSENKLDRLETKFSKMDRPTNQVGRP